MALRQSSYTPLARHVSSSELEETTELHLPRNGALVRESQRKTIPSAVQGTFWPSYEPHLPPISDFGSLNTVSRSREDEESLDVLEEAVDDLDSLDEGLFAFREPSGYKVSGYSEQDDDAILPAHDGLGSFQPSRNLLTKTSRTHTIYPNSDLQNITALPSAATHTDQILEEPPGLDGTRLERIEKWRLEQSQFLLEEIRRERKAALSQGKSLQTSSDKEDRASPLAGTSDSQSGSIWQRFARHIMLDLMGIDDVLLCAILGEDLLPEHEASNMHKSEDSGPNDASFTPEPSTKSWESRIFQRLYREFRRLAQQFSEDSYATDFDSNRPDYAGMPLDWLSRRQLDSQRNEPASDVAASTGFKPTLQGNMSLSSQAHNATLKTSVNNLHDGATKAVEAEYWEQTPDLKTVFRYLYRRLRARSPSSTENHSSSFSNLQSSDALRRVAIIQQHHPLVSHSHHIKLRRDKSINPPGFRALHSATTNPVVPHPLSLKRAGSSCASLSTKRSRRNTSECGSRNYWDLGDSIGSGSIFGGVGTWGEV